MLNRCSLSFEFKKSSKQTLVQQQKQQRRSFTLCSFETKEMLSTQHRYVQGWVSFPERPQSLSDKLAVFLCWAKESLSSLMAAFMALWKPQPKKKLASKCTPFSCHFHCYLSLFAWSELLSHLCVQPMHDMSLAIFICRFTVMNTRWYTWWGHGLSVRGVI